MIIDFFKNILLGGALLWLVKFLQNPAKAIQPIIDVFDNMIKFVNSIIKTVFDFVFDPINAAIGFIWDGLGSLEDTLNNLLSMIPRFPGQEPFEPIDNINEENKPKFGSHSLELMKREIISHFQIHLEIQKQKQINHKHLLHSNLLLLKHNHLLHSNLLLPKHNHLLHSNLLLPKHNHLLHSNLLLPKHKHLYRVKQRVVKSNRLINSYHLLSILVTLVVVL